MPIQLADYGIAIFALALIAWIVVTVFAPRRKDPDLVKVISDNTKALTQLAAVIEKQGEMIQSQGQAMQELARLFNELRLEVVRKVG